MSTHRTYRAADSAITLADTTVSRIAFGAARLTRGDGWGQPDSPEESARILRSAVDAGYTLIDTADALGPGVSEQIIGDTLGNRQDVVVATKIGMLRPSEHSWDVLGHPNYLRQQIHLSLQRLQRDRIDLLFLHRIDPNYPLEDQLGVLQEAHERGDVGAIGISEPTLQQFDHAHALVPHLAAVQSLYNLVARSGEGVAQRAGAAGIPFIAYWPVLGRGLPTAVKERLFAELAALGAPRGLSPHQLSLAWIFNTQPHALAVTGSRSVEHLIANREAAGVVLNAELLAQIDRAVTETTAGIDFDPRHPKE